MTPKQLEEVIMKAKNQDNLKALINLMKKIPNNKLKMNFWECGTAACIGGWIARMPEFKAMGGFVGHFGTPVISHFPSNIVGTDAVALFLGIEHKEAIDLCCCGYDYGREDDVWSIRPDIPFSEVKPSDVVKVLEQWLE